MCTYLTHTAELTGHATSDGDWIEIRRAVVSFDHPERAPLEHAVCIDLRTGDPSSRVALELDAESARRLAHAILAAIS